MLTFWGYRCPSTWNFFNKSFHKPSLDFQCVPNSVPGAGDEKFKKALFLTSRSTV